MALSDLPGNRLEVGARDPEHLALALLRVEPDEGQLRIGPLENPPAAADFAQQAAALREMARRLLDDAAHQIEAVLAGGQGEPRLVAEPRGQLRHAARLD